MVFFRLKLAWIGIAITQLVFSINAFADFSTGQPLDGRLYLVELDPSREGGPGFAFVPKNRKDVEYTVVELEDELGEIVSAGDIRFQEWVTVKEGSTPLDVLQGGRAYALQFNSMTRLSWRAPGRVMVALRGFLWDPLRPAFEHLESEDREIRQRRVVDYLDRLESELWDVEDDRYEEVVRHHPFLVERYEELESWDPQGLRLEFLQTTFRRLVSLESQEPVMDGNRFLRLQSLARVYGYAEEFRAQAFAEKDMAEIDEWSMRSLLLLLEMQVVSGLSGWDLRLRDETLASSAVRTRENRRLIAWVGTALAVLAWKYLSLQHYGEAPFSWKVGVGAAGLYGALSWLQSRLHRGYETRREEEWQENGPLQLQSELRTQGVSFHEWVANEIADLKRCEEVLGR